MLNLDNQTAMNILTLVLTAAFMMALFGLRKIKWHTVEEAIRALAPDEYEAMLIRVTKTVFDSVKAAGADIDDEAVRRRAAELSFTLINLIVKRDLSIDNLDELLNLFNQKGIAVGFVGNEDSAGKNLDRGVRLISSDLAAKLIPPPDQPKAA